MVDQRQALTSAHLLRFQGLQDSLSQETGRFCTHLLLPAAEAGKCQAVVVSSQQQLSGQLRTPGTREQPQPYPPAAGSQVFCHLVQPARCFWAFGTKNRGSPPGLRCAASSEWLTPGPPAGLSQGVSRISSVGATLLIDTLEDKTSREDLQLWGCDNWSFSKV